MKSEDVKLDERYSKDKEKENPCLFSRGFFIFIQLYPFVLTIYNNENLKPLDTGFVINKVIKARLVCG